jgi:hypothetical protein
VIGMAAKLLWRHWPVLFALVFAGLAARQFIMFAAVRASRLNGILGFLVLVLAPIAILSALVLMLRALRDSLPSARGDGPAHAPSTSADDTSADDTADGDTAGGDAGPRRTLLDHLGSVLVPFLAVYASYGYLKEDVTTYAYEVWVDANLANAKIFTDPASIATQTRLPFDLGLTVISTVVVAISLRWMLGRWQGAKRRPWLGMFGAYLEVIWITLVAWTATHLSSSATDWAQKRRVVRWLQESADGLTAALGSNGQPVPAALGYVWGLASEVETVIIIPVAWLAVGAIVYGQRLADGPPPAGELYQRAKRRWLRLPGLIRWLGAGLGADLRERFEPLFGGLRLLVRAGLRPMLLFCLAFMVSQTASNWLWELERLLVGPQDLNTVWRPLSELLSVVNTAIGTVLLICLLGAAVDRVLLTQRFEQAVRRDREVEADDPAVPPGPPPPLSPDDWSAVPTRPQPALAWPAPPGPPYPWHHPPTDPVVPEPHAPYA